MPYAAVAGRAYCEWFIRGFPQEGVATDDGNPATALLWKKKIYVPCQTVDMALRCLRLEIVGGKAAIASEPPKLRMMPFCHAGRCVTW